MDQQTEIQFLLDLILNQKFSPALKQLMKDRITSIESKGEQTEIQFLLDLLLNHKLNATQKQLLTDRIKVAEQSVKLASKPAPTPEAKVAPHANMGMAQPAPYQGTPRFGAMTPETNVTSRPNMAPGYRGPRKW